MPKRLTITEAQFDHPVAGAFAEGKSGRALIQLISPGWGSSGYYSAEVLKAAAKAGVFPAGLHQYADHPSVSEEYDRPERSIRDLAAVLLEDARWDDELAALVAEAQIFSTFTPVIAEMADAIGVSIRCTADVKQGEAEGRRGTIITELVEGVSCDFVTHAGRGGRILEIMESARRPLREASARDTQEALGDALRDAYGADDAWIWVRDFDPDEHTVVYQFESPTSSGLYMHDYEADDDGAVTLTGQPAEVRIETSYVPVDPAGQAQSQESEEDTMPQIEEARLRQLETDAGRVSTLESERDTEKSRADKAERELAAERARNTARPIAAAVVGESTILAPPTVARVVESVVAAAPVNDAGALDETALRTAAEAARTAAESEIAAYAEENGAGKVRTFGGKPAAAGEVTREAADKAVASAFGRTTTGA